MSLRKMGVTTVARRVAKRTAKGLTKSYVLGKPPPGASHFLCEWAAVLALDCSARFACFQRSELRAFWRL